MRFKNVSVKIISIPVSALSNPEPDDFNKSGIPVMPDETVDITEEFAASEDAQRLRKLGYVKIGKNAPKKTDDDFEAAAQEDVPVEEIAVKKTRTRKKASEE